MDTRTGLPVVGVVGGGPHARLTHQAATVLGQSLRVLAPADGADLVPARVEIGDPGDLAALTRFAKGCDVVTFVDERVPPRHAAALVAQGHTVHPGAEALHHARDPVRWRARLTQHGIAVADARRELVALVARSPWGQAAAYPVAAVTDRLLLSPAPQMAEEQIALAQHVAIRTAAALDMVGVLAVMLSERDGGELAVSGLAPGPHGLGLWTLEGARTSQFEQHLRAVLDYPLGATGLTAPAVATATVLGAPVGGMGIDERLHHLFADDPGARVHLYGEQPVAGRLLGHVTVLGDDIDEVRRRAEHAAGWLTDKRPGGGRHE